MKDTLESYFLTEEERPFYTTLHEVDMKDVPLPKGVIMRVRGRAHHSGRVTANGNLYATALYEREAARLRPDMDAGKVFMYPRHPKIEKSVDGMVRVEAMDTTESTGLLRNLEVLPDGWVMLEADIGETDKGKNIAALVKMGAKVPISSRARGTAKLVTLTDKHPAAEENPEWVGKKIRVINEDFRLKTFDFVGEAASGGSETVTFREDKEETMELDISKMTDEQWAKVTESEKFKGLLASAVEEREKELRKKFEDEAMERVTKQVEEILSSDKIKKLLVKEDDAPEIKECPHCKGDFAEGMKFCPDCGGLVEKRDDAPDEKDEAIGALKKQNEELAKKVEELSGKLDTRDKKDEDAEKDARIQDAIDKGLEGKPELVCTHVRAGLAKMALTEDGVEESVKEEIGRVDQLFVAMGITPDQLAKGKGKHVTEDGAGSKDDKLTSEKKQQQSVLGDI